MVKELKRNLFFEIIFPEQQFDIAEGNIFKDIQEVWEEAISIMVFGIISKMISEVEEKEGSKSFETHTQGKGQQQQSNLAREIEIFMKMTENEHKERSCRQRFR